MQPQPRMNRRTVLRGLGVALALPALESVGFSRWSSRLARADDPPASPTRGLFIFVPNGKNMEQWQPTGEGAEFELSYSLQPLAAVKDKVLVISGLEHDAGWAHGDGPGDHARSASVFLTGAHPLKTSGSDIKVGVSVDQVAAEKIGHQTTFASLELGIEAGQNAGGCDSGYSCAYSSNISWRTESTPMAKEVDPRLVFERLFGNGDQHEMAANQARRKKNRASILDFVLEDAKRLQSKSGQADQRKIDEYLVSVRTLEERISRVESESQQAVGIAKPSGIPDAYAAHVDLISELLVMAFRSDLTRVATYMFANAGSNRSYSEIGVPEGHHDLSHHGKDGNKLAKLKEINRFHISLLAKLLEKMQSVTEGNGTLLDHSLVVYGSGLGDGDRHNHDKLPYLLAGGGNGSLRSGRHIQLPQDMPACNMYLSVLHRLGADVPSFGDSTGTLDDVLA